jgi:hypothetical protein
MYKKMNFHKTIAIRHFFLVSLLFSLLSSNAQNNESMNSFMDSLVKNPLIGKWHIRLIMIDKDTAYMTGAPVHTYRYNYKMNKETIKTREDSTRLQETADNIYLNNSSMRITFLFDTAFYMTKMRSGGRFFPAELDTGVYTMIGDTIFMTNRTRNNYRQFFIIDRLNKKMFFSDMALGKKVYLEYIKEN